MNRKKNRLTKERRKEVCVHEAAHAVVNSLGGRAVFGLAVAPVNATELKYTGSRGNERDDIWGICDSGGSSYNIYIRHATNGFDKIPDKVGFEEFLSLYKTRGGIEAVEEVKRQVRVEICSALAGPAAEAMYLQKDPGLFIELEQAASGDVIKAHALSELLSDEFEYASLLRQTCELIEQPDVWSNILLLADALEQSGTLGEGEDEIPHLPESLDGWPKAAEDFEF